MQDKAMTQEEYQEWKAHPLTKKFHQFLADSRQSMMEQWGRGALTPQESVTYSERCQMVAEILALPDDYISEFYRTTKEGVNNVRED